MSCKLNIVQPREQYLSTWQKVQYKAAYWTTAVLLPNVGWPEALSKVFLFARNAPVSVWKGHKREYYILHCACLQVFSPAYPCIFRVTYVQEVLQYPSSEWYCSTTDIRLTCVSCHGILTCSGFFTPITSAIYCPWHISVTSCQFELRFSTFKEQFCWVLLRAVS